MDSPLVAVFLGVIAVTALLQAGFVGALAFGVRLGRRKLDDLEGLFEESVVPQIHRARSLTDKAAGAAHQSLLQAHRVDRLVAESSKKAERFIDHTASRAESAMERAAERVESELARQAERARQHPVARRLSTVSAFVIGLQRALEVWRAGAAEVVEGEEEEEEGEPVGAAPGS